MSHELNGRQRSFLRALAHHLEPVVQIGRSGVSEAVIAQIAEQLFAHELIKVRFGKEAPESAAEAAVSIASATKSLVVQTAGRVLSLYRRHDTKSKIQLPTLDKDGRAEKTAGVKAKKDPHRSLNKIHAAKRARSRANGGGGGGEEQKPAVPATTEAAGRKPTLSRLRAPRASNAARRATVTARRGR